MKHNFPIVSAITALDLPNGQCILFAIHESIRDIKSFSTIRIPMERIWNAF
jgi:hypothetical protein